MIKYIVDELDYPTASGKIGRLKWSTLARASFNAGGAYARIARHEAEAKAKIRDNHASLITKFQADGKNELQAQRDAAFTMAQVKEGDAEAIQTLDMAIAKHSAPDRCRRVWPDVAAIRQLAETPGRDRNRDPVAGTRG